MDGGRQRLLALSSILVCVVFIAVHNLQMQGMFLQMLCVIRRRRANLRQVAQVRGRRLRRTIMHHTVLLASAGIARVPVRMRSVGRYERSQDWWSRLVYEVWREEDWIQNFRMSRDTFNYVCEELRDALSPQPVVPGTPEPYSLSVEKKIAIALYKLASCAEYRLIANQYGVSKSSVKNCVYDFCQAVCSVLGSRHVVMPSREEALRIAERFKRKHGLPQVVGAIDGSHIPILPPADGRRDFVNRKYWPSWVLQAVVDNKCLFRDVSCKVPGSRHDAFVLRESTIFQRAEQLIPQEEEEVTVMDVDENGVYTAATMKVPLMILGDPAYPLLPWLMKGYPNPDTPERESFNVYHSSARNVVEIAFGRLKGRWRCLLKRNDINYKFVPKIVLTSCILHNIIELRKDPWMPAWLPEREGAERAYPQPVRAPARGREDAYAVEVRDHLCAYMAQNFPLRLSRYRPNQL